MRHSRGADERRDHLRNRTLFGQSIRDVGLYQRGRRGRDHVGVAVSSSSVVVMRWVLVVVSVLAMVAAACSGDDGDTASDAGSTTVAPARTVTEAATTSTSVEEIEVPTTTVPSAEVIEGAFTFAFDDLCTWVSAETVAEFVAAEFDDPDVTAVLDESSGGPEDLGSCQWYFLASTAPDEFGSVSASNAGRWTDFSNNPWDWDAVEVADFDEDIEPFDVGSAVSGHPSLSDGVVYYAGGFGQYAFWVPPSDEYLSVYVSFPRDQADHESRVLGVADRFVQELGWLG